MALSTENLWDSYDGKGFAAEYAQYSDRASMDEAGLDIHAETGKLAARAEKLPAEAPGEGTITASFLGGRYAWGSWGEGEFEIPSSYKSISFDYMTDAPCFSASSGGYTNLTIDGVPMTKLIGQCGVTILFDASGNTLECNNFDLTFKRYIYTFSGVGASAQQLFLMNGDSSKLIYLSRIHHYYNDDPASRGKNQILCDTNSYNHTKYNDSYYVSPNNMSEVPMLIHDSPLYDTIHIYRIVGENGTTVSIYVDGVRYCAINTPFTGIRSMFLVYEVNSPIASGEYRLLYN